MNRHPVISRIRIALVLILLTTALQAQDSARTVIVSMKVGESIDRDERDLYRLFPAFPDLREARFFALPDGWYAAQIRRGTAGGISDTLIWYSDPALRAVGEQIDRFREIAAFQYAIGSEPHRLEYGAACPISALAAMPGFSRKPAGPAPGPVLRNAVEQDPGPSIKKRGSFWTGFWIGACITFAASSTLIANIGDFHNGGYDFQGASAVVAGSLIGALGGVLGGAVSAAFRWPESIDSASASRAEAAPAGLIPPFGIEIAANYGWNFYNDLGQGARDIGIWLGAEVAMPFRVLRFGDGSTGMSLRPHVAYATSNVRVGIDLLMHATPRWALMTGLDIEPISEEMGSYGFFQYWDGIDQGAFRDMLFVPAGLQYRWDCVSFEVQYRFSLGKPLYTDSWYALPVIHRRLGAMLFRIAWRVR
jgi:hypothetical protein